MKLSKFEMTGVKVGKILTDDTSIDDFKKLYKNTNIFFVLDGINRLQSTLLCELGVSYVQQSQRYVNYSSPTYYIPNSEKLLDNFKKDGEELINKSFDLYHKMTELKDPNKKGRLTKDDFKYGIAFEDARYIFPLCVTTNVVVSMSADRLYDLWIMFYDNNQAMQDIKEALSNELNENIVYYLDEAIRNIKHREFLPNYSFGKVTKDNNVIMYDSDLKQDTIAIATLASQNEDYPDDVFDSWEEKEDKSSKMIERVVGYGHYGILEHLRTTFIMECSLSAYHQVIRHRLQNINREDLFMTITRDNPEFYIPVSILNSEFKTEYEKLVSEYTAFYHKYKDYIYENYIEMYLLNCHMVRFVISSNTRNDNWIFRERLCLTAQDEIRELYGKKFEILYNQYPVIYKNGLPPCVLTGKCKEGKLCCGKITEMKEKYSYIK